MKISQRVANILSVSRAARNSDKELWLIYAQKSGMALSPKQIEVFKGMPAMETIRRTRQALQEHGQYPADKEVEQARYNKFVNTRQSIMDEDPEKLLESKGYRIIPYGE